MDLYSTDFRDIPMYSAIYLDDLLADILPACAYKEPSEQLNKRYFETLADARLCTMGITYDA